MRNFNRYTRKAEKRTFVTVLKFKKIESSRLVESLIKISNKRLLEIDFTSKKKKNVAQFK